MLISFSTELWDIWYKMMQRLTWIQRNGAPKLQSHQLREAFSQSSSNDLRQKSAWKIGKLGIIKTENTLLDTLYGGLAGELYQPNFTQEIDEDSLLPDPKQKPLQLEKPDIQVLDTHEIAAAASEEAVAKVVEGVIAATGASGMKDMGRVMGIVSKELAGQAAGKVISSVVRTMCPSDQ